MAPPRALPSDAELLKLRADGVMQKEVAERYGVRLSAVQKHYQRLGVTKPRPRYEQLIPWTISNPSLHSAHVIQCLRFLGRTQRNIEEGLDRYDGLNRKEIGMLQKWLSEMGPRDAGGLVVDYDPECPPNPASPVRVDGRGREIPGTGGGFWYREWESVDGKSYVRQPLTMQRNARTGQRRAV